MGTGQCGALPLVDVEVPMKMHVLSEVFRASRAPERPLTRVLFHVGLEVTRLRGDVWADRAPVTGFGRRVGSHVAPEVGEAVGVIQTLAALESLAIRG